MSEQNKKRVPVPGWVSQEWQQRNAEEEDREVPGQYGQRMTLDPVGYARSEGSIAPLPGGHHRERAHARGVDFADVAVMKVVAILPRPRRRECEYGV